MTTGINPEAPPVARRWAAELLGVPENAPPVEARRAYFRKLRESDFLPPRSLHHALRVLEGQGGVVKLDEEWLLEEEGRRRAEVESFAAEFITLPVGQRRQRWEELLVSCQGVAPLTARLQALKAGLEVEVTHLPAGQSFHGRLAEHLLQSFPLSPLSRGTSRQAFLRELEDPEATADRPLWEKAARYLVAEWPALAALDRELVQHVARLRKRLARRSKMHRRSQRQRAAAVAGSGNGKPWWLFLVVFGLLGGVMRGMTTSNNSSSPRLLPSESAVPPGGVRLPDFADRALIQDLLDPAKFDVEIVDPPAGRTLRFTPRTASLTTGVDGPQVHKGQPVTFGEVALILMGASRKQVTVLFSRAAGRKRPGSNPNPPPKVGGPKSQNSSPGGKTRP